MREEAAEDSSIRLSVRRQSTFTIMAGLSHIDYAFAHALFQRIRRDSDRIRMMQTLQVMQALGVSANEAVDDRTADTERRKAIDGRGLVEA